MLSTSTRRSIDAWNRKLHNYVGLFLLTFIWLFSLTGILLNHPTWEFTKFWATRVETSTDLAIRVPEGTEQEQARDLMSQARITGELNRIVPHSEDAAPGLDVRVLNPGRITEIKADFSAGKAVVKRIQTNAVGVAHWLHHFTGVRMGQPEMQRDWVMTKVWSFSMDAVCAGLIFLVISSLYMWYPQLRKRRAGWFALGAGTFICGFFMYGLSWFL